MQNERVKKYKSKKIIPILICIIVLGLFSLGYAMTSSLWNDDGDVVPRLTDLQESDIIADVEDNIIIEPKKGKGKANPSDIKESEGSTIIIGDVNAEHKDDPDYITCQINIKSATYMVEEDGELIEKEFQNIIGGFISIPKEQSNKSENVQANKGIKE